MAATFRRSPDYAPHLSPAGKTYSSDAGGSAACIHPEKFGGGGPGQERPPTPEAQRRYRRSYKQQVGATVPHYGKALDQTPDMVFGRKGRKDTSAQDLINPPIPSIVDTKRQEKEEQVYLSRTREPLGRSLRRGHEFPEKVAGDPNFRFGAVFPGSQDIKELLHPEDQDEDKQELAHEMYVMTHGKYEPGEQRRHGVDWKKAGIDPKEHVFGHIDRKRQLDGVKATMKAEAELKPTVIVSKQQGDSQGLQDALGKPRNLGFGNERLSQDYAFGMPSCRGTEWGTAECLRGQCDHLEPDEDLGKTGTRNVMPNPSTQRVFGVPTIRDDIIPPKTRSVTNTRNYGGEPNALGVIYPSKFAHLNVWEEDFCSAPPKEELWDILLSAGVDISPDEFDHVYEVCEQELGANQVTLQNFREIRFAMKAAGQL